jgi:hypothetical protein
MRFACVYLTIEVRERPSPCADGLESRRVKIMEEKIFASDHLYLSAFLVCCGHNVVGTSRNGWRVSFEFHKTPDLLGDVGRFMSGAAVPARQFAFEVLKLKRTLNGG